MRAADYQDRIGPDRRDHSAERCDQYTPPDLCTSGKYAMRRTDAPAGPDTTPGSAPNAGHTRAPPHSSARRTAAADVPRSIFPGKGSDSRERHTDAVPLLPSLFRLALRPVSRLRRAAGFVLRQPCGLPSVHVSAHVKGSAQRALPSSISQHCHYNTGVCIIL